MEQGASSFGDYRLDRANRFIHDRLVSHGSDGLSVRRSWWQSGRGDTDWPFFEEWEGVGGQDY